ncbi:hypothetical protein [Trebonia sp.]|uniref:hypothetical protein n=1 Tax=Trebonia sp. TaxID=2767075 RepID=UPI0026282BBB|nr:hypothetical protein [Trebonia sp.]
MHGQSYAANAVNVVLTAINNTGQPVTLETESVVFYDGNEEISSVPDIGWDEVISAGQSVRGTVETNISGSNITSCQVVAYNAY